jgi:GT2 family glycosyltransferase/glycosyltransferase involved in cell wall biosynthesis/SAM-dependent methyltransferase
VKILHVCHDYWPAVGGSELLLKEVSERLVGWGEEVRVFTSNALSTEGFVNPSLPLLPPGEETIGGVPVRRFPTSRRFRPLLNLVMQAAWRLRLPFNDLVRTLWNGPTCPQMIREIIRAKPDLVTATAFPFQTMYYPFVARLFRPFPIVLIPCFHPADPWSFDRPIMEKALKAADALIALTEYERDHLVSMGVPRHKLHVVGAGTDPERFQGVDHSAFRRKHGIGGADPIIAFVGRMEPEKGVATLLEAMPRLWRAVPSARLVLAGPATHYSSAIAAKIAALPLEDQQKVILRGAISEDEKCELLAGCDLLALPSRVESFGIVYLEAWACGKPVIGCRTGAVSSLIEDEGDGLLVTYGDAAELAAAIVRLASDEPLRRRMGEKGRAKVVDRFNWNRIAEDMLGLYRRLTNEWQQRTAPRNRIGVQATLDKAQGTTERLTPLVSVLIVCTNERQHLAECLGSLQECTYPEIEVIVSDNGSTDGSVEFIRRTFPSVKVIESGKNLGFPEANNRAMRVARGRYLFLLNPDTRIDPRCIDELVRAMEEDENIGIAAAKMKIYSEPDVLNSAGIAANHILYGWDRGAFELDRGQYDEPAEVIAGCGGALMVRRSLVERIGELDARFFMYYEDLDFGIRTWLSGSRVVFIPQAVVYHKYKAGIRKALYNEYYDHRNRLRMMLKNFSPSSLAWMLPASLMLNIQTMAKYLAAGRHRDALHQFRALLWNLAVLPNTLRERRNVQRLRAVPDAAILALLDGGTGYPMLSSAVPAHQVAYEDLLEANSLESFVEMGKNDDRQLGLGWHQRERWGDRVVRWTSDFGIAFLGNPEGSFDEKRVEIEFCSQVASGLTVRVNDQLLGECESEPGKWHTRQFDLKHDGRRLKLILLPKEPFIPSQRNGGPDNRLLGVAVSSIRITVAHTRSPLLGEPGERSRLRDASERYSADAEKTAAYWGEQAKVSIDEKKETHWLESLLVQELYIYPTTSGRPDENWLAYVKRRYFPKMVSRGLDIGCGQGGLERHGSVLQLCDHYDAYDVSPEVIYLAKEAAAEFGLTNVTYEVRDLNHLTLEKDRYDAAFSSMAIHHIENLENLFDQVHQSLKPGGLFVFNEYVGPDRFQWTPLQLMIVNLLLQLLPLRLRRNVKDGTIKRGVPRPDPEAMKQIDPSEAVRSSAIVPLVGKYFRIIERIDYGGTIINTLLQDIVGNFREDSLRDLRLLRGLFWLEGSLLNLRILPSDFTVIVARRD